MHVADSDPRLDLIKRWLPPILGRDDFSLAPASADASFRRYFRISFDDHTRIVMDAPPAHEDCRPFIKVSNLLLKMGLTVPEVLHQDLDKGLLLLTDLGTRTYLNELEANKLDSQSTDGLYADSLYSDAMAALIQMQRHPVDESTLPPYDLRLLMTEMTLFSDWYLQRHLRRTLSVAEQNLLDAAFAFLAESALSQPKVLVHRDYHSRNLMVCQTSPYSNPGILDFQDAVIGPLTYDLVSLLRDCYIKWSQLQVQQWLEDYFQQAREAGVLSADTSTEQFQRWFDFMGIQRHLKASGIFARLNYRDNKPGYLNDIPRTLSYIVEAAADYPELADFRAFIQTVVTD